jgi:hypothetical protein
MPNGEVLDLMSRAGISFIGTVQRLGEATLTDVPTDDRTAVVRVDQVLHTPQALTRLAGSEITVQLAPGTEILQPGERAAFFTNAVAVGDSLAVTEVARLPVEAVEPDVSEALTTNLSPQAHFGRQLEAQRLGSHAAEADAVVVARVRGLQKVGPSQFREHDPDRWRATLDVSDVERGDLSVGEVDVLYYNSLDVMYRSCPKPRAGQEGLWLLHATEGEERDLAPYVIPHPEDYQPAENLTVLRTGGSQP